MSAPINDGGPAFPTPAGVQHNDGMTLRDWFAAAASEEDIQEFMPTTQKAATIFYEDYGFLPSRQWARYCHADVMLKARESK
jgi:hypothetical protein